MRPIVKVGMVLLVSSICPYAGFGQLCPAYNTSNTDYQNGQDSTQHIGGAPSYHDVSGTFTSVCQYGQGQVAPECAPTCDVNSIGYAGELGSTQRGVVHVAAYASSDGRAIAPGGAVTCGAQVSGAVRSCSTAVYLLTGCNMSVGISVSSVGLGASVSYSSTPLWDKTLTFTQACPARSQSSSTEPPGSPGNSGCGPMSAPPPPLPPDVGAEWVYESYPVCGWVEEPCSEAGCQSPIIIDTDGHGFDLTDPKHGIKWDFFGNSHPVQIAWTAKGSTNGWLALPVNGKVTSSLQLFGNITAQPASTDRNGFLALAQYDANHDDVIDKTDPIWPQLRIWIDTNHDGVSQAEELHTLDQIGIRKIDLKYREDRYTDQYGNKFRYKGHLGHDPNDSVDRIVYDVFLLSK